MRAAEEPRDAAPVMATCKKSSISVSAVAAEVLSVIAVRLLAKSRVLSKFTEATVISFAVTVPPDHAAEMRAYDILVGEFRVHYAGFFDPGFGYEAGGKGSRAVLEVRSHEVPFVLVDPDFRGTLRKGPSLCDVAPTLLGMMCMWAWATV